MLRQFFATFLFSPVVIAVSISPSAIAQTASIDALRNATQQAVCLNEWNSAIQSVNQLMGLSDVTPAYREALLAYRRQLEGYRSSNARVDMRQQPGCQAAIAQAQTRTAPTSQSSRSMNWDMAIANISGQQSGSTALVRPTGSRSARASTTQTSAACSSPTTRDRRVATGTISNRWQYEMFEGSSGFYIYYWQQHDCRSVSRFYGTYPTQSELREEFTNYIQRLRSDTTIR